MCLWHSCKAHKQTSPSKQLKSLRRKGEPLIKSDFVYTARCTVCYPRYHVFFVAGKRVCLAKRSLPYLLTSLSARHRLTGGQAIGVYQDSCRSSARKQGHWAARYLAGHGTDDIYMLKCIAYSILFSSNCLIVPQEPALHKQTSRDKRNEVAP